MSSHGYLHCSNGCGSKFKNVAPLKRHEDVCKFKNVDVAEKLAELKNLDKSEGYHHCKNGCGSKFKNIAPLKRHEDVCTSGSSMSSIETKASEVNKILEKNKQILETNNPLRIKPSSKLLIKKVTESVSPINDIKEEKS